MIARPTRSQRPINDGCCPGGCFFAAGLATSFERPIECRPRDPERLADVLDRVRAIVVERPGHRELAWIIELARPATGPSSSPRRRQSGPCPLADQLALELGESTEDMEDEFSAAGRGVNLLGQAPEADPPLRERVHQLDQVRERPSEPVKSPDDEHVAGPQEVDRLGKLGAIGLDTADRVLIKALAAGRVKRVALECKVLVIGRYAGVANEHVSIVS